MSKEKVHSLVCYLYNSSINSLEKMNPVDPKSGYVPIELAKGISKETKIRGYLKKDSKNQPNWVKKLSSLFNFNDCEVCNISNSFIFFVEVKSRVFAYTMGYSHHLVDKAEIEHNFGLIVTLNEIDHNKITAIDARKITSSIHQKREVSSDYNRLRDFEFDFNQELISCLSGSSNEKSTYIDGNFTGADSLKIKIKLDIGNILDFSKRLLDSYEKDDYKEHFDFINNIKLIKNRNIYERCYKKLFESIKSQDIDNVTILPPINVDLTENDLYLLNNGTLIDKITVLNIKTILDIISQKQITLNSFSDFYKLEILISGNDNVEKFMDWIIYEYVDNSIKYIYTENKIFEIKQEYLNGVISFIQRYEVGLDKFNQSENVKVPSIFRDSNGKIESEGEYNIKFASSNSTKAVCLDKNNFRKFPDRPNDQVEICDVVTITGKKLICVKKFGSSAQLSHLFMQGLVSAELLSSLKEYRDELNEKIKERIQEEFIIEDTFNIKDFTIVYAICVDGSSIAERLPFFSKISLRTSIINLQKLGINVEIIKINIEDKVIKDGK